MEEIEAEASPQEYARLFALACIRRTSPGAVKAEQAQSSLLSLLD